MEPHNRMRRYLDGFRELPPDHVGSAQRDIDAIDVALECGLLFRLSSRQLEVGVAVGKLTLDQAIAARELSLTIGLVSERVGRGFIPE